MPKTYLKIAKSKAEDAHVQADISNHRGQNIENEERRERLRRILESRKAKSVNDQEKVQSAVLFVCLFVLFFLLLLLKTI